MFTRSGGPVCQPVPGTCDERQLSEEWPEVQVKSFAGFECDPARSVPKTAVGVFICGRVFCLKFGFV